MTTHQTDQKAAWIASEAARHGTKVRILLSAAQHGARSFSAERIDMAAIEARRAWSYAERVA